MKPTKFKTPVYVTKPMLTDLEPFNKGLTDMWESKYLTNDGPNSKLLENKLKSFIKINNVSLFNNGTNALITAFKALDIPFNSEIITTPFTFPATPHSISWNGMKPVFCDIEPETMTINSEKIEALITPNTSAILPVHVYGFPCNVEKIQEIANKHNLKVIYDAAHAFTTEINGKSIAVYGDISMFSFHATKLFHTMEGGCLAYNDDYLKDKIDYLRNFGIKSEEEVVDIGINGKMNELQALMGVLNLDLVEKEKELRKKIKKIYIENLNDIDGIKIPCLPPNVSHSMQYFVIKINKEQFGVSRNQLYEELKKYNVFTRKYFYPLCSEYEPYKYFETSKKENLPVANKIKEQVLCLPFYGELGEDNANKICEIMRFIKKCINRN